MITYFPIFQGITYFANPKLEAALASVPVSVIADPSECSFQFNPVGTAKFTTSATSPSQRWRAARGWLKILGRRKPKPIVC